MKYITVFSDASHHPDGHAGYAYFLRDESTIVKESHALPWKADRSTDVEEFAMCHAILRALDTIPNEPGDEIVAQTDCTHVIYRFEVEHSVATKSVIGWLTDAGVSLRFKHVRAHSGVDDKRSYVNRWCDSNARREMRLSRAALLKPSSPHNQQEVGE